MYKIIPNTSDKAITQYIKNYILKSNMTTSELYVLLRSNFNKHDINKIKNGTYIFDISDFIYLTQKLNLDLETIFNQIKQNTNNLS